MLQPWQKYTLKKIKIRRTDQKSKKLSSEVNLKKKKFSEDNRQIGGARKYPKRIYQFICIYDY